MIPKEIQIRKIQAGCKGRNSTHNKWQDWEGGITLKSCKDILTVHDRGNRVMNVANNFIHCRERGKNGHMFPYER